jgi:hypothetical protein
VLQEAEDYNPLKAACPAAGRSTSVKSARPNTSPRSHCGGLEQVHQEATDMTCCCHRRRPGRSAPPAPASPGLGSGRRRACPIAPRPAPAHGGGSRPGHATAHLKPERGPDATTSFRSASPTRPSARASQSRSRSSPGSAASCGSRREVQQDADESVRAQQLLVRSGVTSRYLAWQTAYEAIAVQAAGRDAARDQVRAGAGSLPPRYRDRAEVSDAQIAVRRAEGLHRRRVRVPSGLAAGSSGRPPA